MITDFDFDFLGYGGSLGGSLGPSGLKVGEEIITVKDGTNGKCYANGGNDGGDSVFEPQASKNVFVKSSINAFGF